MVCIQPVSLQIVILFLITEGLFIEGEYAKYRFRWSY